MVSVFVYGTLKPGGYYYRQYCQGKTITETPAWVYGQLYDLPLGYPGMTLGRDRVYGYWLTFTDEQLLTALDALEDYDPVGKPEENFYTRQWLEGFTEQGQSLGYAWVYVMEPERVTSLKGTYLPTGIWEPSISRQSLT